jgi:hypothetical protein
MIMFIFPLSQPFLPHVLLAAEYTNRARARKQVIEWMVATSEALGDRGCLNLTTIPSIKP